jgi:hypothetical protein
VATKKQKRAAALAKREAMLEEIKAEGLAAQEYDRRLREIEAARGREWSDRKNEEYREILQRHGIHE